MRHAARLGLFGLLVAALAAPGAADEVDELVAKLKPPARFADHKPDFSVAKQRFAFEHLKGPVEWDFWVIKDRDRHVAVIPLTGFHGGTIYLLDFNPETAPTELRMPTERWHIDTAIGSEMRTDAWIPDAAGETDATYEFTKSDGTLTLTRRFRGTTRINKWEHHPKYDEAIDTTGAFVFRCDPVFGYVVEGTWDTRVKPAPKTFEYVSLATAGRYSLWPGTETCFRTVSTPRDKPGYEGYYLNLASIGRAKGFTCRNGGFAAFLNDETGWSPTMTLEGSTARFVVCNAHADLDFVMPWAEGSEDAAAGMKRRLHKHRMLALPPELTRHVWDKMDVAFQDQQAVQIRIGRPEGFEDQPLPLTTRVRGLTFVGGGGPDITDRQAHSGKRSMVVKGKVWPNIPQLVLKPNATYRLEAWIKVADASSDDAKAYILGDLYEWSPHSGEMVVKQKTGAATPGDWQKVSLEFTAPKWGPFINMVFIAEGCTAYVDDFVFAEVNRQEQTAP